MEVNTPLDGAVPIDAAPLLVYPNTLLTSVSAVSTHDYTVCFLGTAEGHLKKVSVLSDSFSQVPRDGESYEKRSSNTKSSRTLMLTEGYIRPHKAHAGIRKFSGPITQSTGACLARSFESRNQSSIRARAVYSWSSRPRRRSRSRCTRMVEKKTPVDISEQARKDSRVNTAA